MFQGRLCSLNEIEDRGSEKTSRINNAKPQFIEKKTSELFIIFIIIGQRKSGCLPIIRNQLIDYPSVLVTYLHGKAVSRYGR